MPSARTFVLVVAAGSGQRFGGDLPKQYQTLAGKPMLRHSLETFAAHPGIAGVVVAIHPAQRDLYDAAAAGVAKLLPPVEGGATRQGSVLNGLERLAAERPDYVLIHDAARPLIDPGTISRTIEALAQHPAILVAVPVVDTIKRGAGERVGDTVDRRDLWRAQTPQAFHFAAILEAHRKVAGGELTDDAAVAEAAGIPVTFVMGSERNFKVTTQDDMERAERMIGTQMEFRTGNGFDVHRIIPGDGVTMCGVRIPCDMALEGPFGCGRRAARHHRRDPGRDRRQGHRRAFPAERSEVARRRILEVPGPRRQAGGGARRPRRALRRHHHLRAPEGRPAPRCDGEARRRNLENLRRPGQREGDDHGKARLHRPRRRHRRAGHGDGGVAGELKPGQPDSPPPSGGG